jgi:hypothetical protein
MLRWLKTVVVSDEEKAPVEASGGDREGERERIVADVPKPLGWNVLAPVLRCSSGITTVSAGMLTPWASVVVATMTRIVLSGAR